MAKHAKSGGVKLFSSKSSSKTSRHSQPERIERPKVDESYLREFEDFKESPVIDDTIKHNPIPETVKEDNFPTDEKIEETVLDNNSIVEETEPEKENIPNTFESELLDTKEIPAVKVPKHFNEAEIVEEKEPKKVEDSYTEEVPAVEELHAVGESPERKYREPRTTHKVEKKPKDKNREGSKVPTILVFILGLVIIAAVVYVLFFTDEESKPMTDVSPTSEEYVLSPKKIGETDPANFISSTDVMVNDEQVEKYSASYTINMKKANEYSKTEGVLCYLGNNFRNTSAYGTASLIERSFGDEWTIDTSSLKDAMGNEWSGNGWTGQPLIVRWPEATKKNMESMYTKFREKENLVEVIMPCMDGKIYFLELETGEQTRDPLDIGYSFKGTGALDPRGYPILYVGSGADSELGKSRVFVINLLDNTVMYKFGYYEPFALRDWNMWDSSPLIDAETDQLIYAGENGLVYIIHLNTMYDESAGALTVNPDKTVKWRYTSNRTTAYTYWSGFESSPVCWQGLLYLADNGGNLMCLDLNSLELKWVKNTLDDTDCSPVLSIEEDGVYIYIGTSFHPGWREEVSAAVPVWKINAVTGETVWEKDFDCISSTGLCSGVQGNIVLGQNKLSGIAYVPVAEAGSANGGGYLVALDTASGEVLWEFKTSDYSWSTPVLIYDSDGNGFVGYCTMDGNFYLIDGITGNNVAMRSINGVIESSPAVFENTIVVGTRNSKIFGIQIR